jgi:hypothetical protein
MARSRSCSPPSPPRRVAASEVPSVGAPSSSCKPQPPLNPNAQPFSPSSSARAAGEELPEWLLFNPLLSEGSSSSLGHLVGASPSPSFADVVKGKGMAPQEAPPPQIQVALGIRARSPWTPRRLPPLRWLRELPLGVASWRMPAVMLQPSSSAAPTYCGRMAACLPL